MLLLIIITLGFCQQCPGIFYLSNIQSDTNLITYSGEYNILITAQQNTIFFLQAESGTLRQIKLTDGVNFNYMVTDSANLFIGGKNELLMFSLDEQNQLIATLSFLGTVTYIQSINSVVSIGTNNYLAILWNPTTNTISKMIESLVIQNIQTCYQIYISDGSYETIIIGISSTGTTTLEYYTSTMEVLVYSKQIQPYQLIQITSVLTKLTNTQQSTIYAINGLLLYIYVIKHKSSVTFSESQVNLPYQVISMYIENGYLALFYSNCYYQTFNTETNALGSLVQWITNCPDIKNLIFNIDDMLITLLLNNVVTGNQMLQIYSVDSNYAGTQIRSFYYLQYDISYSYILISQYILEVGKTNNNIYVYNQWFQLQQTIIINNQPTYALQIIQSGLILILFNDGLVVTLSETTATCQFTGFQCFTYAVSAQFQQSTVTTFTSQLISTFTYNNIVYAIYALDKTIYFYSFINNVFTLTNSQTLANNIIQILCSTTNNQIELLLDNDSLQYYSFAIATSSQTASQTVTYTLPSTKQVAENDQYQIITNGQNMQILQQSNKAVLNTIENPGINFEQISIYDNQLIALEKNTFSLCFMKILDLVAKIYEPNQLYFQEPPNSFVINQNFIIIQFSSYIMVVLMNDFFSNYGAAECNFSQTYSGTQGQFISTQTSLASAYLLLQALNQLDRIQGQISVSAQNIVWTQIVLNQSINKNVILTIKGTSPTTASIIISDNIDNFRELHFQDITLILPKCILSLSNMQLSEVNNCLFIYQTQVCAYFFISQVGTFTFSNYKAEGFIMLSEFISTYTVETIILTNIEISNSQLAQLVTIDNDTQLELHKVQITTCKCNLQLTNNQLFQYFILIVTDTTFQTNTFCSSIFGNIISNFANKIQIDVSDLNVLSNTFTNYQNAAIINQLSSNTKKTAKITLATITLTGNTYPTQYQTKYSFFFTRGVKLSAQNMVIDNSAIGIYNYDSLTMNTFTFSTPSQLCIHIEEVPSIYMESLTFSNGQISLIGLIQINNQADYDCSQANSCLIRLIKVSMSQIKIISSGLANTCYAIYINVKNAFEIQLSQLSFFGMLFQSSDQNLIPAATGVYVIGYQSQLLLNTSTFYNSAYSLSTSVLILNALVLTLNTVTVNSLTPLGQAYYGTSSEKGGVAQVVCSALYIQYCNFTDITSYSGSIFIIELYHSPTNNPLISFQNNIITNVFSYGSGAIYIENVIDYTAITVQNNQFGSIFSVGDGGVFYFQTDSNVNHETLNFNSINIINIDDVQPQSINRKIIFLNNVFWNLYSSNGSILKATAYNIQFTNNLLLFNNQTTVPTQLSSFQITQGSMLYLQYCVLNMSNFTFNYIQYFSSQINEGLIVYSYQTWIKMYLVNFTNIITKNSQMLYLQSSYFNTDQLMISNISLQQSRLTSSLIEIYNSAIYMTNPTISVSKCKTYSCTTAGLMIKNTYAYLIGGFFSSNEGNLGGVMYISITREFAVIESAIFILNYANSVGGAIVADLQNVSTLVISNSQFSSNTALDSGGAIYLNSFNQSFQTNQTQDIAVVQIINSQFAENTAHKYGGAIKQLVFCPFYNNVNFTNNVAQIEGSDISSYPTSLFLALPLYSEQANSYVYNESLLPAEGYSFAPFSDSGQFLLQNFKSGDTINQGLSFLMKSSANQTMYNDAAYLKIQPTGTDYYTMSIANPSRNINEQKFVNGSFTLEGVILIGKPTSSFQYFLNTDEIKSTNQFKYYYTNNYNYTFNVIYRQCLYGEILQTFDNQTICYQCPEGFYSFTLPTISDPGQCLVCPLITTYHIQCFGGAQTNLQPYYWRENIVNLNIQQCDQQLSYCAGGISEYQCGLGYMGRMCQACDYDNNFGRDSRQQCIVCTTEQWPLAIILLTSIGIMIYFLMSIFFLAQDVVILCVLPCLNQLLPPLKKIGSNLGQVKDLNSLMKIFLAYYQKISLVTKIVVDIPAQFEQSQDPSILDFSLECPLINLNNYIPMVYVNYIIEVLKPVSSMLFFMLIWTLLFRNQSIKRGIYYTATWLVIWLFYLPSFYEKTLQLLNCKVIGDGRYLKPDLNQSCYGTEHFFYTLFISIPCLVFFVIYIPVMLLYHIRNDMRKKNKRPLRKYKYYYINGEFREKFYYWEFIRLLEKILIQTAIEIFFYDNIYMAESCLIIVLIYGIASFVAQPYGYKRQNFVNVISSFTAFGTIYIALVIATLRNQFTDPNAPIIIFFEVLLAAINAVYALWMSWKLFIVLMPVLFVNIEQIQRKVANIGCLRRVFLGERLRSKLLFQRIGQKVVVINLIKKHALMRYNLKEQKEKQLLEIEDKIRNRKQTAAHDALTYILRNQNESNGILKNTEKDNREENIEEDQIGYIELQEYAKQNQ